MSLSTLETVAILLILRRRRRIKRKRKFWIHPLNLLRPTMGECLKVELMYSKYPQLFFDYTRLTPLQFDTILSLVKQKIVKSSTNFREPISERCRLIVTLRYLSTGDSIRTIATSFSLGRSTIWKIVWETAEEIWNALAPLYLKPLDEAEWIQVVQDFEEQWNFPNCLGAIDGKHVMIQAPPNSGSAFFNYKGFFSVVLLATCDAKYQFTTVDIGAYGRQSDGGIFTNSRLGRSLEQGTLPIPGDRKIKNSSIRQPCTFVGDEAFGLSNYMMRPFPGVQGRPNKKRIFNYRLSRARRIIENCFGILGSRFRIYKRVIHADPDNVCKIIKATIALHNLLRADELKMREEERLYCPPGYVDKEDQDNGAWRKEGEIGALGSMTGGKSNTYTKSAKQMRDNLADYFCTNGSVPWQNERACIYHSE